MIGDDLITHEVVCSTQDGASVALAFFLGNISAISANLSAHIKRHEGSIKKMVNDKDGEGQMPLELAISGETQTSCGCCLPQVQM